MTTGHNSGELTADQEKAHFFHHLRRTMSTKAKIKDLQNELKSDRKVAQSEGVVLSRMDFAERALGAQDKSTITQQVNDQLKIMEWLHIIPAYNEDLLADRAPREEKIEGQGEIAGLAGADRVSNYAAASADDKAWLRGYDRGQGIMRDNLGEALKKKKAAATNEEPAATGDDPFDQSSVH